MTNEQAVKHVEAYLLGLDIAVDCERRIFAAYKPELDEWETRTKDPAFKSTDKLIAMVRNALDARSNVARIEKDAAAIRAILEPARTAYRRLVVGGE